MRWDYIFVATAVVVPLSYVYWIRSTYEQASDAYNQCILDEAQQFGLQRRGTPTEMLLEIKEDRCLKERSSFNKSLYWDAQSNVETMDAQEADARRAAVVKVLTTWQDAPKHPAIGTYEEEEIALRKNAGPVFSETTHVPWDNRIVWTLRDAEDILLKIEERFRAAGMEIDESEIAALEWGARILLDEMKKYRQ